MSTTKEKLHMLLADIISAEDYAKAIEIAKTEEDQSAPTPTSSTSPAM